MRCLRWGVDLRKAWRGLSHLPAAPVHAGGIPTLVEIHLRTLRPELYDPHCCEKHVARSLDAGAYAAAERRAQFGSQIALHCEVSQ